MKKYFVLNHNKTFHLDSCHHIRNKRVNDTLREFYTSGEALAYNYNPCGKCLKQLKQELNLNK